MLNKNSSGKHEIESRVIQGRRIGSTIWALMNGNKRRVHKKCA